MFVLIEIGLVVFLMGRIADMESRSPVIWGGLTLVLCLAATALIPIGYLSPIIGGGVAFLIMLVTNALQSN